MLKSLSIVQGIFSVARQNLAVNVLACTAIGSLWSPATGALYWLCIPLLVVLSVVICTLAFAPTTVGQVRQYVRFAIEQGRGAYSLISLDTVLSALYYRSHSDTHCETPDEFVKRIRPALQNWSGIASTWRFHAPQALPQRTLPSATVTFPSTEGARLFLTDSPRDMTDLQLITLLHEIGHVSLTSRLTSLMSYSSNLGPIVLSYPVVLFLVPIQAWPVVSICFGAALIVAGVVVYIMLREAVFHEETQADFYAISNAAPSWLQTRNLPNIAEILSRSHNLSDRYRVQRRDYILELLMQRSTGGATNSSKSVTLALKTAANLAGLRDVLLIFAGCQAGIYVVACSWVEFSALAIVAISALVVGAQVAGLAQRMVKAGDMWLGTRPYEDAWYSTYKEAAAISLLVPRHIQEQLARPPCWAALYQNASEADVRWSVSDQSLVIAHHEAPGAVLVDVEYWPKSRSLCVLDQQRRRVWICTVPAGSLTDKLEKAGSIIIRQAVNSVTVSQQIVPLQVVTSEEVEASQ